MPSSLGRWGRSAEALLNVRKGTKKYFTHQTGRNQGGGRELPPIN